MKFLYLLSFILSYNQISAQTLIVSGQVTDLNHNPLAGAAVYLSKADQGTLTDSLGRFELPFHSLRDLLVVSHIGYISDTLVVDLYNPMHIMLDAILQEQTITTVESSSTFVDRGKPVYTEVITNSELSKEGCCGITELFDSSTSVDVSFTDFTTGTQPINLIGLDGKYALISREEIPVMRGLNVRQEMQYTPHSWLESIRISKGTGGVARGYESMTGHLNFDFIKPETGDQLNVSGSINSFGRGEFGATTAFGLSKRISTALLTNISFFNNAIDTNKDGFMDLPKAANINVLNRYSYSGDEIESQLNVSIASSKLAGGETSFAFSTNPLDSELYGFTHETVKAEIFGNLKILFPEAPFKGWGFTYSASVQNQENYFGRTLYRGNEKTLHTNMIHQSIFENSHHQYKFGSSFFVDIYEEIYADSSYSRSEVVPGTFLEYSYIPNNRLTLVGGSRMDFHNLYGLYFTPRAHLSFKLVKEGTIRLSAGKGFRTANVIPENNQYFISSRELVVEESFLPEESWNFGVSYVQRVYTGNRTVQMIFDYFYTTFLNQVVVDLDQNPQEIHFYNLRGRSFAHNLKTEMSISITPRITSSVAYKYYKSKVTINEKLRLTPFVPQHRLISNLAYASMNKFWTAKLSMQWHGKKRLPDTALKPEAFRKSSYSPDFFIADLNLSRHFTWGDLHFGITNLLNFYQDDPIINPDDPFGEHFDSSLTWGPVTGRAFHLGFKYRIE